MTGVPAVLDAPTPLPAAELPVPAGAVGLLVDGGVSSLAAAAWAARLARDKATSLVVVVLVAPGDSADEEAAALLARVQPTLDGPGRPYAVRVGAPARGVTVRAAAARTARHVRELLPDDLSVLVCPGDVGAAGRGGVEALAARLAQDGWVDLLVVPDLRSRSDALAPGDRAAGSDAQPEAAR